MSLVTSAFYSCAEFSVMQTALSEPVASPTGREFGLTELSYTASILAPLDDTNQAGLQAFLGKYVDMDRVTWVVAVMGGTIADGYGFNSSPPTQNPVDISRERAMGMLSDSIVRHQWVTPGPVSATIENISSLPELTMTANVAALVGLFRMPCDRYWVGSALRRAWKRKPLALTFGVKR